MTDPEAKTNVKKEPVAKTQRKPSKELPKAQYSLCIPSSCISASNCSNLQQITHVAYQIAKAACIYNVGEVLILQVPEVPKPKTNTTAEVVKVDANGKKIFISNDSTDSESANYDINKITEQTLLLASLLQFFVTPPYLLKATFKPDMLKNFEYAKKLPKISTLPFMQNKEVFKDYKEGLTVESKKIKPKREKTASGKVKKQKKKGPSGALNTTKYVNVGESTLLELEGTQVPSNVRVTVNLKTKQIVSPIEAYGVIGAKSSFGYFVRVAKKFSSIFTESGYPQGYDKAVYVNTGDYFNHNNNDIDLSTELHIDASKRQNVVLILGKYSDMENCFRLDKESLGEVPDVKEMFDCRLNIPVGTRIEEGALISLATVPH